MVTDEHHSCQETSNKLSDEENPPCLLETDCPVNHEVDKSFVTEFSTEGIEFPLGEKEGEEQSVV